MSENDEKKDGEQSSKELSSQELSSEQSPQEQSSEQSSIAKDGDKVPGDQVPSVDEPSVEDTKVGEPKEQVKQGNLVSEYWGNNSYSADYTTPGDKKSWSFYLSHRGKPKELSSELSSEESSVGQSPERPSLEEEGDNGDGVVSGIKGKNIPSFHGGLFRDLKKNEEEKKKRQKRRNERKIRRKKRKKRKKEMGKRQKATCV